MSPDQVRSLLAAAEGYGHVSPEVSREALTRLSDALW